MTQQQYGRAIVRGEQSFWTGEGKPDWLPGDALCQVRLPYCESVWSFGAEARFLIFDSGIFRLPIPQYQFVYDALDRGFKPWFGGEKAPGDWDFCDVLWSDCDVSSCCGAWTHKYLPDNHVRIIGYRPRTSALAGEPETASKAIHGGEAEINGQQVTANGRIKDTYIEIRDGDTWPYDMLADRDWVIDGYVIAPRETNGIYNKATHVPVRMMTGQEVFCLASNCEFEPMAIIRALGIIRPDPDPAQVIADKLGADVDLVRAVMKEMGR